MNSDQLRSLLQENLQSVGQQNQLLISRTTFNDAHINQLLDSYYGGSSLVITDAAISENPPDTSQVVVTGHASLLNVVNIPVQAIFLASSDRVDITLRYQLPTTWKFSQSFPSLLPTWSLPTSSATTLINPSISILDLLTFTDASFLISTMSFTDEVYQVQMNPGLNFACHLKLNGLLGAIEETLPIPEPLTLAGPIILPSPDPFTDALFPLSWPPNKNTTHLPGIGLKADVPVNLSIGQMTLKDIFLIFYSPLAQSDYDLGYQPGLFFGGTLQIGAQFSAEVVAEKMLGEDNRLVFTGLFDGLELSDLSQFAALMGGDDLLKSLIPQGAFPPFFTQGSSISLQSASLMVTCSPFSLDYASVAVGLGTTTWSPIDGVSIEHLEVLFRVIEPFNSQRSLQTLISGTLSIGDISLTMSASAPDFLITAFLPQGQPVSLKSALGIASPPLSDLTVDTFSLGIQPTQGFLFSAALAEAPQPWSIELGPETLTLSNMRLLLGYSKGAGYNGSLSGSLALAGIQLDIVYQYPGPLTLRGQFPALSLKTLVTSLCGGQIVWPSGFDLDLKNAFILLTEQNGSLSLQVATEVKELGLIALTIQKQTKWGVALGVDLSASKLSALPGLGVLAPIEAFIGLDALFLVFSSLDQQPNFQFPDLVHFNMPASNNRRMTLPPQANGLTTGLNLYAQLNTTKSGGFQALAKYLKIRLDGSVGITLAISLPDPATSSKVFLSVNEEIQKGTTLVGELGGFLQGSDVGVYLAAIVKTQVQSQPLEFNVSAIIMENGVLISGTMQGTIHFDVIHLSNLALVIGIDLEGIPSLGIAATLDVKTFESSLAVFFDSADPAKSLVAGALNNVSLRDVVQTFTSHVPFPSSLSAVFSLIALNALGTFHMPALLATSLDHRDLPTLSSAFKQYGNITLPATSDRVLLIINQRGASWHLTDLSTMKHYSLTLQGQDLVVVLQPQLYVAPQPTSIGSLQYSSGFNIIAQIDYLLIHTRLNIQISPQQGIMAETDLTPIVLFNETFFAIIGTTNQVGPRLSLATYTQPQIADPQLRSPHLLLSGTIRLLGADLVGIYVLIDERQMNIQVRSQVNPLVLVDLKGSIDRQGRLDIRGTVFVGIDRLLDAGQLGSLSVKTAVNGQLHVAFDGKNPSAGFTGGFVFQTTQYTLPALTLDVNSSALQNIAETLWQQVKTTITNLLKNPDVWLSWVHSGAISDAGKTAEAVVLVLLKVYHLSITDIATKMEQIMGYSSEEVAMALQEAMAAQIATGGILGTITHGASGTVTTLEQTGGQTGSAVTHGASDTVTTLEQTGSQIGSTVTHGAESATHDVTQTLGDTAKKGINILKKL